MHRHRRGEQSGRRVEELGGVGGHQTSGLAAHHENSTIGQQDRACREAGRTHGAGGRKRSCHRVIYFGGGECSDIGHRTASDQDAAIRQGGRGMHRSGARHGSGVDEGAGFLLNQTVAADAAVAAGTDQRHHRTGSAGTAIATAVVAASGGTTVSAGTEQRQQPGAATGTTIAPAT